MKTLLIFLAVAIIALTSCGDSQAKNNKQHLDSLKAAVDNKNLELDKQLDSLHRATEEKVAKYKSEH